MAISNTPIELHWQSQSLREIFGNTAHIGVNANAGADQDSDIVQADALALNPGEGRTEMQRLIAILKQDGPEAAINKALVKLDNGHITMEQAYDLADYIYARGYTDIADQFADTLDITASSIEFIQAQQERMNEKQLEDLRQEQERARLQRELEAYENNPEMVRRFG